MFALDIGGDINPAQRSTFVFLSVCFYRELIIIATDRAFSFRLLCFVKQTPLQKLIDATLFIPEVGFFYELFYTAVLNWVQ